MELRFCWRTGAGAGERVSAWAGSLQHRSSPVPRKGSQGLCRARLRAPARGSPRGCRGEDTGLGPGLALSGHRKPCTHPRGPESLPSRSHVGHGAHVCPQTHLLQDRAPRELLCVGGSVSESGTRQVQIQIPALLFPGCAILDKCLDFSDRSIKGCGNAKVVKTLVAMTTALCLSRSGIQVRALAVTACLRAGLELPAVRSGFSQATCFVTLGRKSPSLCFSFLAVGTAPPQL